ncbi:MAG TPA: efflux RND transporter periplasmic adaptor subunit, partial [Longimicrobiales bacterium]
VERGAIIARLEAAEYLAFARQAEADALSAEATRREAEASLAQAERNHARAVALGADSLLAPQALEDARAAVDIARARLEATIARVEAARQGLAAARANLENTNVRAPFAGTVLRLDAEVGEVVAPSVAGGGLTRGAVVTMADLSTLEVEVDVNESYIATVRHDQPADIVLDAYPTERFPGHVRQIVPTADRQKATVLVRVAIDSSDPRILPEMGARVVFQDSAVAAPQGPARVFVPAAAVRSEGGADVVYVVSDEHAQRRIVQAGPVMGEVREVRSGLAGGEMVVLNPPADLADGTRVRIVSQSTEEG